MATISTIKRNITVEESYELIAECLQSKIKLIELTEIINTYSDFPPYEVKKGFRKILIQSQYIIDVVE